MNRLIINILHKLRYKQKTNNPSFPLSLKRGVVEVIFKM